MLIRWVQRVSPLFDFTAVQQGLDWLYPQDIKLFFFWTEILSSLSFKKLVVTIPMLVCSCTQREKLSDFCTVLVLSVIRGASEAVQQMYCRSSNERSK